MFRNYFKTAWRNLLKNKFYSFITVSGLALGLAVGILILFWVQDELSFDGFHKNSANIYKLENRVGTGSSVQIWQSTAAPIGKLSREQLPEIQEQVKLSNNYFNSKFQYKDKSVIEQNLVFADPDFFTLFDFNLVKGNPARPFTDDNSIVITQTTSKKYFGDEDPIGKVLVADDSINYTVSGLINDIPLNSSFKANIFFPNSLLAKKLYVDGPPARTLDNDFNQFNYATYLLIRPGTDLKSLATRIRDIHLKMKSDDTDVAYLFLPITKAHLFRSDGTESGMETVRMFIIIAIIILVIACINYVNLSTARSMLRSREVSLRKIVGAGKGQLFIQFIVETTVLFILAAVLAVGLIALLLPAFNTLADKSLRFEITNCHFWLVIGSTIIGTLIVSSIYPALLLSSFQPLKALKGKISSGINDAFFRKALVVTQFAFSIILIIGTFIIGRQLKFVQEKDLGYNKENVFSFRMRNMADHYEAAKADLLNHPGILNVTRSSGDNIVSIGNMTGDNDYDGKGKDATFMLHPMAIAKDFIPFFEMKMAEGANFTGSVADSAHVILNETAVRESGIKDPIGKRFRLWKTQCTIIGVAKDFHYASVKEKIAPAVFFYTPGNINRMYVRTTPADQAKAIAAVQTVWKQYEADYPLSFSFLDDTYTQLYQSEQRTGRLFNIFAGIAIFISCLGLLGLTAYTAQIRTREIGVRKVLGSSAFGIVNLLAKDFIALILISIVIAVPIAWYAMNKWLQDFAYKVNIGWTVFVMAGALAIVIALITISFQSVKAALANPIRSLRVD